MPSVKYHYALDEQERLVCIDDVSIEDRQAHSYHCLNCGAGMIPRMGKVRSRHFAHRGDEDNCGNETCLHKLAKRLIKEKFYREGAVESATTAKSNAQIKTPVLSPSQKNVTNGNWTHLT